MTANGIRWLRTNGVDILSAWGLSQMIIAAKENGRRTVITTMIKIKFNFYVGLLCGLSFVVNVVNGRDRFMLVFTAFAAILNLICAFIEK